MHPIWLLRPTLLTKIMTAKSIAMNGRLPDKAVTRQRIFRLVKKMGGIAGKTGGIAAKMCAIAGRIVETDGKISGMPVTIS